MLPSEIEPANPPLPVCWYLPFQLGSVGIQTSKWMFDWAPGLIVPATRQRSTGALVEPETVLPAVYDWASVIVVSGSRKLVRSAQLAAAAEGAACIAAAAPSSSGATRLALHRRMNDRMAGKG